MNELLTRAERAAFRKRCTPPEDGLMTADGAVIALCDHADAMDVALKLLRDSRCIALQTQAHDDAVDAFIAEYDAADRDRRIF